MSSNQVRQISDAEFGEQVQAITGPVVVEFFATWCGNCRRLAPVLDRLATEFADGVEFVTVNVDRNPEVVATYGVSSTPTLIVLDGGRLVTSPLVGAHPEAVLREWLHTATHSQAGGTGEGDRRDWVPADACTLPTADQPLRVAEFGSLFADSLRGVRRVAGTQLRLELDADAESAARDLVARETDCCDFFSFTVTNLSEDTIRMDIEVPDERREVLDGLAEQAATAQVA